jgi:hypothetical protein
MPDISDIYLDPQPREERRCLRAPRHISEGHATSWVRWFAWRPVKTEQGRWVWLRHTYRRRFLPPLWFVPPAPFMGWMEYSDERRGPWERRP